MKVQRFLSSCCFYFNKPEVNDEADWLLANGGSDANFQTTLNDPHWSAALITISSFNGALLFGAGIFLRLSFLRVAWNAFYCFTVAQKGEFEGRSVDDGDDEKANEEDVPAMSE